VSIDAGLFRIDDISAWTGQVYGIGEIGDLIDVNVDTLTLDLIDCPVRANGGASGQMKGRVQGLFFRYRSVGGFDYIAELLIGPGLDGAPVTTHPGDSGTVWFWDAERDVAARQTVIDEGVEESQRDPGSRRTPTLRPIGLQWGGQSFLDASSPDASNLRLQAVCRPLAVFWMSS
jgi:hypothetical protein